jgi:hypothetical protein
VVGLYYLLDDLLLDASLSTLLLTTAHQRVVALHCARAPTWTVSDVSSDVTGTLLTTIPTTTATNSHLITD